MVTDTARLVLFGIQIFVIFASLWTVLFVASFVSKFRP